jgi:hypothetical protein|tara:strand:- start:2931 stop:3125 length:195 start_codon:yes stop_codon:yes gene_type:complete
MIQFYNVRKKEKVQVDPSKVEKKVYTRTTKNGKISKRYAFAAVDEDGTKMTKFCSKADYDKLEN